MQTRIRVRQQFHAEMLGGIVIGTVLLIAVLRTPADTEAATPAARHVTS
jgi:hypothetical protein